MTMCNLAGRLKSRMDELGWKQADLVRQSGISKAVISVLLSDPDKDMRASSLLSIATALQVDPVWLFTGLTGDEWQAKHGVSEAKASQLKQKQRKTLPRLNRSKFYPRTFFN